ncbi:C40 family peptidase [Streptomyces sp. MI02-7b]|uniref:C40 family peptidase n=1 Tax=Streptomyces sp. MI02-7b TaxID=462941 RepID=UPI0029AC6FA3|nr:C40 family peptidase [Streptomyces sp. MI02-7b]MDX3071699.1 C40 family peptidase [Streptomyces sp. MI02-7b]
MHLQISHIRRRRRATQSTNWVRRAGVAGGVIGTLALTGMSAPANAEPTAADPATTGSIPVIPALSTEASAAQAAAAIDETVVEQQLDAARDEARAEAMKAAAKKKAAADARKAAAAKAAEARESATASRSAGRTALAGSASAPSVASVSSSAASGSVASVLSFLKAQVGKPYVYGATGPSAYDCSGLTQAAFRTIGVELPRTSQAQSTFGTQVPVSEVQPGDLLFWGGVGSAYHVAVYVGDGQYLDAANPSKGVVIQQMAYYMPTSAVRVA